jgi:2-keto-4-pentenoate hydratase/2-oxohepta-3-ene-1,7-dioic acid hydratase in catechol pathway
MAAQFVQRGKNIVAIGRNYVAHIKVRQKQLQDEQES